MLSAVMKQFNIITNLELNQSLIFTPPDTSNIDTLKYIEKIAEEIKAALRSIYLISIQLYIHLYIRLFIISIYKTRLKLCCGVIRHSIFNNFVQSFSACILYAILAAA